MRISIVGFARADSQDDERSHADLREAYWGYESDDWDVIIGVNKVFWGVTESRHLVDVINQTDLVEDIDQEDKLGQPMINIATQRNWGQPIVMDEAVKQRIDDIWDELGIDAD